MGETVKMRRFCKVCHKPEDEHHIPEWIEQPETCVCDIWEWNYHEMDRIPPVCEKYDGDGVENCLKCEHDKGCHLEGK